MLLRIGQKVILNLYTKHGSCAIPSYEHNQVFKVVNIYEHPYHDIWDYKVSSIDNKRGYTWYVKKEMLKPIINNEHEQLLFEFMYE